ncbi:MAG TPA: hypothetical protein VLK22_04655 [Candidatus Udaeobacter sp.]|nr:hypothetical protein [Candidatus Udaeobacter sp.]
MDNHNELENIKNEIITKMGEGHRKSLSWNNTLITVILGVLTLVSIGQMAESIHILNKLKSGNFGSSSSASQVTSPQDAPAMVGGC